jgi:hypothetical protein
MELIQKNDSVLAGAEEGQPGRQQRLPHVSKGPLGTGAQITASCQRTRASSPSLFEMPGLDASPGMTELSGAVFPRDEYSLVSPYAPSSGGCNRAIRRRSAATPNGLEDHGR